MNIRRVDDLGQPSVNEADFVMNRGDLRCHVDVLYVHGRDDEDIVGAVRATVTGGVATVTVLEIDAGGHVRHVPPGPSAYAYVHLQMAIRCITKTCIEKMQRGDWNADSMVELLARASRINREFENIVPRDENVYVDRLDEDFGNISLLPRRRGVSRSRSRSK